MPAHKAQGFALIDLIFVCGIIGLLCSIALPRFIIAKQTAGASSAIGSMRALSSAQLTYALTCGSGFYSPNLTTLGALPPGSKEPFIGGGLGIADQVIHSGYMIQVAAVAFPGAPATCNGLGAGLAGQGFVGVADPTNPVLARYFATNASFQIYENTSTLFGTMPEVGAPPVGAVITH